MSFINKIKYKFKTGSIIEKLIYINIGVFAFTLLITVLQGLYKGQTGFVIQWFSLDDNFNNLLTKPLDNCFPRFFTFWIYTFII